MNTRSQHAMMMHRWGLNAFKAEMRGKGLKKTQDCLLNVEAAGLIAVPES